MAYKRYIWVDEESQLDAYHLNNIEDGLEGIIDGDLTVDKANKDGDGNIITGSYGSNINFEFDNSTGMVTLKLLAKDGSILQTSSIDLPTEYLIKEIYLDDVDKNLVFVLSNDTEIKCDISAIYDKIDTKVDKVEDSSTFNRAYGVDTNGKQKMFNISKAPNDSALGQYTSAGNLVTNDPTAVLHAANKRYVDNTSNNLKSTIPTDINVDSNHKLILEHDGVEIPNQNKKATLPPFNIENSMVKLYDANNKIQGFRVGSPTEHRFSYLNQSVIGMDWEPVHCTFYLSNSIVNPSVYVRVWTTDNNSQSGRIKIPYKDGTMALIEDLANYTPISETNNIKALIPPQANKDNQLADKNFVNSSINSSAAYFIGSFATYADLLKWQNDNPTKATNNDYAYVEQDETHNNEGWRYIYVKTDEETVGTWKPQFKVNDTPFTAAQLAAINSNITSDKVTTFDNHVANKENPHGVTKEQVGLGNVDNTSDLDKPISTATSTALENLTKVIPTDINAKSQFFYADLILEHDGKEITGQKKLAKIPAWKLLDNADYPIPLKKFMKAQFIEIINLGINGNIFFPLTSDENVVFLKRKKDTNDWYSFDVDTTVKSDKTQILLTDANTKTINGESIYGTGNIETNPVFDFTSLDFTNVLNNLSDKGYARVTIEDETLKNNLKTIFDRLQNNKTSFIEFPKLKTGARSDEEIQKTRMFALIQNSIYLGTEIYGLYGLMYFYGKNGNQDVLTEIRINTNLDTYNSIEFIDVKRNLVEKSSNKKIVYTNNDNGTPSTLSYSVSPNNSAIAQFNVAGQLYSNAPTADIHVANKQYVDGRFDYVLLTQSAFIYNYPLEESDRLLLIDFYNKHYQKDKIPLFVVDRNGFTTTLRIAGTNIIHIFIWSDSQAPIVFFIDLTQTNIKFNRIIGGHLHSILGQSSWSGDVNARIGVNSDNKLIITDEAGNQTPGQLPSVLIPPFTYKLDESGAKVFTLDGEIHTNSFYYQFDNNLGVAEIISELQIWGKSGAKLNNLAVSHEIDFASDSDVKNIVANIAYDDNEKYFTFTFDNNTINLPTGKSGTVALTSDLDNKLDVITYDETKIMYDDNNVAPLPADLKALIKPYFDNNKPFVLILYNDTTITTYYLKGMRIATDNELTFISFNGDADSSYTILYFDMTSNDINMRFINIAEHEDTVQYQPDVAKAVYVNNENKQQSMVPYSLLPGDSNLAQFDTNGHLYTNDPNIDSHCANKKYVDSAIENNLPYGTNADIDNMF